MLVHQSENELLEKIQHKRLEMIRLGEKYGLSSQKTINCSQELDKLLNEYLHLFQTKTFTHHKNPQPKLMLFLYGRQYASSKQEHFTPANLQ